MLSMKNNNKNKKSTYLLIKFCLSNNYFIIFLDKNLYVHDLEDIDPELSKSLVWMLDNDVEDLMYDFSYIETILG